MTNNTEIEVNVSNLWLSIRYRDQEYLVLSIDEQTGQLCAGAPGFDDINWVNGDTPPASPLTVVIRERKPVEELGMLPTAVLHRLNGNTDAEFTIRPLARPTPVRRPRQSSTTVAIEKLAESDRDEILEKVLDSWVRSPAQSKTFVAIESHRIAREVLGDDSQSNVMRVAGVRAALERGVYGGSREYLVEQRRRERQRRNGTQPQV